MESSSKRKNSEPKVAKAKYDMSATALGRAAESGDEEKLARLLEEGADPDGMSSVHSRSALWRACAWGNEACGRLLIKAGADVEYGGEGESPLLAAAGNGNLKALALLLACGADPNAQDEEGRTALYWASLKNLPGMAKALLEAGAEVCPENPGESPALMAAALRADEDTGELCSLLLEAGAGKGRELRAALDLAKNDGARAVLGAWFEKQEIEKLLAEKKKAAPRSGL